MVEQELAIPGDRWLVPRHSLERSQIRIEPAVGEGCTNVAYSFEVPDIRTWVVQSPGADMAATVL